VPVVVRECVKMGGKEVVLKTYQPAGKLSREDRERADRLDEALSERVPKIADEVMELVPATTEVMRRWFLLGKKLRTIVDDDRLVLRSDVNNGLIWQGIWYHLPDQMKPSSLNVKPYAEQQHKRKDHLSLCYEVSAFEWPVVEWIKRWADWHDLAFRPGILRDERILRALGDVIGSLERYPSRREFREIIKRLGQAFPTRRFRESSLLADEEILRTVEGVIRQVMRPLVK